MERTMKRSSNRESRSAPVRWHVVLAWLAAASTTNCGGTSGDGSAPATAGTGQAGSAAAGASGASQGGAGGTASGASGGVAIAGGAGGSGGSVHAAGSSSGAGSAGGPVCGDRTCGANQYCRAPCNGTGFGGSPGVGGNQARGSCAELPSACNGVPSCDCICGPTKGFCTPGAVEVQCGCP